MTQTRPEIAPAQPEDGELSGPANSFSEESIDCGCGRYRLPRLVGLATRRTFLALVCCVGALQAAAQTYFDVTAPSVARRFRLDPYLMEWILCTSETALIIVGFGVAYWGDRIHRAAWLGGLTLIQSASYMFLLIPHFSHRPNVIEEPENVTHMSVYAEESPDLCMEISSRLIATDDPPQYTAIFILIAVQIITAMANVAFYSLGFSYLDDNMKKVHVSVYFGIIMATKISGSILGYILGWGFLRIGTDNLASVESYANQTGAWWLGWPILAFLLSIPAVMMAIFPKKLPSEMVEQAAATILDQSNTLRGSQRNTVKQVGSTEFLPSMLRLLANKLLICNILAGAFLMTALVNFVAHENIFLESRFYAPRPTGMLLGFRDPLLSRIITTLVKPILISLTVIMAGLVIARVKPKARTLVNYSFIVIMSSALVIFCLALDNCAKAPIVGSHRGTLSLNRYCNKDCRCSQDADFRPICDSRGTYTFYSPCYAGCTSVSYKNNSKMYSNCSCIEETAGLGNTEARDGLCKSDSCQIGWLIYEIITMLVYAATASTIVGDLLISLRCINVQDKALAIGYSMGFFGLFVYILGKISFDQLVKSTCQHWGINHQICHLHHPRKLGNYLCFLSGGLIIVSALFKIAVWFLCQNLEMYDPSETKDEELREMKDIARTQEEPLLQSQAINDTEDLNINQIIEAEQIAVEPVIIMEIKKSDQEGHLADGVINEEEANESRLKYGPVEPGDRTVPMNLSTTSMANPDTDDEINSSDSSQIQRKSSTSQVSYKPLQIDSDVESDLSGSMSRLRTHISSISNEANTKDSNMKASFSKKSFPNPDNYEDPRIVRSYRMNNPNSAADGLPEATSFEYSKGQNNDKTYSGSKGDFNELGIPVVESYETAIKGSSSSYQNPIVTVAMQQLDKNPTSKVFDEVSGFLYKSENNDSEQMDENRKFRLEKLMQPVNCSPVSPRPPSRDQASSGFGSLQDMREKIKLNPDISNSDDSLSSKSSESGAPKKGSPLCTNL